MAGRVTVEILTPTDALAVALAADMRAEDAAEVLASGGYAPLEALRTALEASDVAYALVIDGRPAAMWGVLPGGGTALASVGVPWLLTGSMVSRHPKVFLQLSRPALRDLLGRYVVLVQAIDSRYAAALRWARWLGGEVRAAIPFGRAGEMFHPVTWRSHV